MSANKQELEEARGKIKELLSEVGLENLNSKKREYLKILWRRAAWLNKRITNASKEGKVLYYDGAEMVAIKWAVNQTINQEAELKRIREEIADLKKGGGGK